MAVGFATPLAALAALAGVLPVAVALVRGRQARRVRRELGLPEPLAGLRLGRPLALGCAFALLGLAAAQPSLASQHERTVRTDAQMLVVLDTSRSMLASSSPGEKNRFRRAVAAGLKIRSRLGDVPVGIASMTDRLLPHLFPTADQSAFRATLARAVARPGDATHWAAVDGGHGRGMQKRDAARALRDVDRAGRRPQLHDPRPRRPQRRSCGRSGPRPRRHPSARSPGSGSPRASGRRPCRSRPGGQEAIMSQGGAHKDPHVKS